MNNTDLITKIFGISATEIWSMPEEDLLIWLSKKAPDIQFEIKGPRVYTYAEARTLVMGTDVWIEYKHKSMIFAATLKSFTQGAIYKWFNFFGDDFNSIRAMEYGWSVRFWNGRPTVKQREEVSWK